MVFSKICTHYERECEHKNFDARYYIYTCIGPSACIYYDPTYGISNETEIDRNTQDNKSTMIDDSAYTICPHCGHKIYKEK